MVCKMCKKQIKGRSDKKFCGIACKNDYHVKLRKVTNKATHDIDQILHRNRSILLEIMGKNKTQISVSRDVLDKKKFQYKYLTGYVLNSRNKYVNYVYDFSWIEFSKGDILIYRKKS